MFNENRATKSCFREKNKKILWKNRCITEHVIFLMKKTAMTNLSTHLEVCLYFNVHLKQFLFETLVDIDNKL